MVIISFMRYLLSQIFCEGGEMSILFDELSHRFSRVLSCSICPPLLLARDSFRSAEGKCEIQDEFSPVV